MAVNCHFCETELQIKIDLGRQPLANALLDSPDQEEFFYDAKWGWCPECQLLQLANPPALEQMFTGDYPFITDSSKAMVEHFKKTAEMLTKRYGLIDNESFVVEIGANSGGVIEHLSCPNFGYETSDACTKILSEKGICFISEYFDEESAYFALESNYGKKADLIYSANTLRSIPQLESIFKGAYNILKDDGVFVIEEPYLMSILEGGEIDQFYDENVYCFTVTSIDILARRFGFRLIATDVLSTHGGSLRYHLSKNPMAAIHDEVFPNMLPEEEIPEMLDGFMKKAEETAVQFREELIRKSDSGERVSALGATAKSTVVLNYAGIGTDLIACIYDSTNTKWGKYTAGVHIPIVDEKELKNDSADTIVLLAWNHQNEILRKYNGIKNVKWLVYVPNTHYL